MVTEDSKDPSGKEVVKDNAKVEHQISELFQTYHIIFDEDKRLGETLYFAAAQGNKEKVRCLVKGFPPKKRQKILTLNTSDGDTAIAAAARNGCSEIVKYILDTVGSDEGYGMLIVPTQKGPSIVYEAACNGYTSVLQTVENFLSPEQNYDLLTLQDSKGDTGVALSAHNGHAETVKYILDTACFDRRSEMLHLRDPNGRTILHRAAINGHTGVLRAMLPPDTNNKFNLLMLHDNNGDTVVAVSACSGFAETLRFLLSNVQPNERYHLLRDKDSESSILHRAACKGHTDILEVIIASITPDQKYELMRLQESDCVVSAAACNGHAKTVELLLGSIGKDKVYGALKVRGENKRTLLHRVANKGYADVTRSALAALDCQQRLKLLMEQDSDDDTAITLAAYHGHTDVLKTIINLTTEDELLQLLKLRHSDGDDAIIIAAFNGKVEVLRTIIDSVSMPQKFELLMGKDSEGDNALTVAYGNKQVETVKYIREVLMQYFASCDPLSDYPMDLDTTPDLDVLPDASKPLEAQDSNQQEKEREANKDLLSLSSKIQSLQYRIQELQALTQSLSDQLEDANRRYDEAVKASPGDAELHQRLRKKEKENKELGEKIECMVDRISALEMFNKDAKEEIELLKNEICELEVKVEGNEEGDTSEADNGGAMAADPNSDIEEVYSESSDEEYYPIDPGLISSLKMFCQHLSIQNCRVLQNPHIWQVITVLGTDANTKMSEKLGEFYAKNSKFKEQGYRVEVLDRQWKDHSSQLSLKFHGSTVTNSTCELIVQEQQLPGRLFAVGPAHMLFCPSANKEFQTENCDIHHIRNEIDQACPNRHQTQQVCPVRAMKVKAGNDLELHVDQTPYIAYRYRYRAEDAPPTRDDPKRYTNDCVLLRCDQNKADHVRDGVRNACWLHSNTVDLSVSALQSAHDSRREIKVKNYKGRLCNVYDLSERIDKCEGIHLTFVITSKKRDETLCELKPGDSGSIVYYVGQETTEDGRKETYEPWGMLIESTKMGEGYTVYSAIVLHQAFRDIVDDYGTLGQIDLFRPHDPHPAN